MMGSLGLHNTLCAIVFVSSRLDIMLLLRFFNTPSKRLQ